MLLFAICPLTDIQHVCNMLAPVQVVQSYHADIGHFFIVLLFLQSW
ncbi:hypothetical Protein YC6258_02891 [Gynuella sunshinyii YC6258]|uniref:Uncharacterized protein n=1 Tax=Gynuella sunshinyii YC6258 TaxID=1445510 RepID=A0A0C5VWU4_9GAMM|nr:hypothetical Protein YC6258_02891 [Gynuella sunshinyii YC6258]